MLQFILTTILPCYAVIGAVIGATAGFICWRHGDAPRRALWLGWLTACLWPAILWELVTGRR